MLGRAHVWHADDRELVRVAADVIGSALARRDAAEETRLTESRFRALVQNSGDALIVIDENAVISHMPLGTRLFGYTPEQLFGMNTLDLVHPDDLDFAATEMIRAVTEPDYVATNAMRIRHADGHWVPIELMASSHFDDPAINGVVMNVRDHTERDAYAAALRISEERHRTLIANLPGAVYRCRATPPYEDEFVSDMIEALTGYTAARVHGQRGRLRRPDPARPPRPHRRRARRGRRPRGARSSSSTRSSTATARSAGCPSTARSSTATTASPSSSRASCSTSPRASRR